MSGSAAIIDAHVYSLSPRLRDRAHILSHDEEIIAHVIHDHEEGPEALGLSDPKSILESMDRAGVGTSVLVSLPWSSPACCRENNDFILEEAARSARLEAVCAVQPFLPGWEREAERVLGAGALGIKINPEWQSGQLDSVEVQTLAGLLRERNRFLMTHVDHAFRQSSASPAALFQLAKSCPETRILAAHLGGLLGMYNTHAPVGQAIRNIWFDTAVSATLEMVRAYVAAGLGHRLVFGSDFPFNHSHSQAQVLDGLRALDLGEELERNILAGNFRKLAGEGAP